MNSLDVIALLKQDGWYKVAQSGAIRNISTQQKGRVTVPHPKKDLPTGTVKNIYKQAGLK
ncbi:type II toxin-antitoxin system HicA family toxin [Neisseria gonorrhoeae]